MRVTRSSGDASRSNFRLRSTRVSSSYSSSCPGHNKTWSTSGSETKVLTNGGGPIVSQQLLLIGKTKRNSADRLYQQPSKSRDEISSGTLYGVPVGLALLLYLNTISAGFVYDDHRAVVNNPDVVGTSSLSSVFEHDFWGAPLQRKGSHGSWRPLTTLSFRLNAFLSKTRMAVEDQQSVPANVSWQFHAANIALHGIVTCVYVGVLHTVGIKKIVCLWAGTLFAAHPIHVEAVGGIVGRAELLAAIAFCLAIGAYIFYLRGRSCGWRLHAPLCPCLKPYYKPDMDLTAVSNSLWLWISIGATIIGIMCKEQAITALGVALILHIALVISTIRKNIFKSIFNELWLPCLMAALLVWWRISLISTAPSFTVADNPAAHAPSSLTQVLSVGRYWVLHARLLLLPDVLSFDWSMGAVPLVSSFVDIEVLPLALLLLGCSVLISKTARDLISSAAPDRSPLALHHHWGHPQHESCQDTLNNNNSVDDSSSFLLHQEEKLPQPIHVAFALALLIVPFLPASNLMAWVGFVAAERVLYLPSMGSSLLIALGAQCVTISLADILIRQCTTTRLKKTNYKKLKRKVIKKKVFRIVNIFWILLVLLMGARTIRRNADWHSDETLYTSGIAICPAKALANLGVVYSDQERNSEAELAYRSALQHAPNMADTHYNLGLLLMKLNRPEESLHSFQEALRSRPWLAQAHLSLSSVLMHLGHTKESMMVLETCIRHANAPAKDGTSHMWAITNCHQRLSRLKIQEGSSQDAISDLQIAISNSPPGYPKHSLMTLLAEAYVSVGDHVEAQLVLNKALKDRPGDVPAHLAFSRLLQANGSRLEDAEYWIRRAVAIAPNDALAHKHLGQLLLEQGRAEAAIDSWLRATTLDPLDHTAVFNSATALRLAGRTNHAETFYKKAVQIQPKDVSSQRNLGAILHLNGKLEQALHHYKLALVLVPGDPQTTTNMKRLKALFNKNGLS